jgi:serine/threonine-protein kinase RsbW
MSSSDPPPTSLTVASQLTALIQVRAFIEALCREGRLDAQTTASIVLAVHEAVANIIRHGHGLNPALPITIECAWLPDGFEILMEDHGKPFDINEVPEIDPAAIREGGRGVYLMRALMDELSSCPRPGGGNTLRMVKRCQPGS